MAERKKYTAEFKTRVVLELLTAQKGLMQASRDYGIKDTILKSVETGVSGTGSPIVQR